MTKKKEETVEVTIKLPKPIADYLKMWESDLAKAITETIVGDVKAQIEALESSDLMELFNVKEVFKRYGLLVDYSSAKPQTTKTEKLK